VITHFRSSLNRACALARSAGAKLVFVNPAANLRDFSPFKSEASDVEGSAREEWERLVTEGRRLLRSEQFAEAAKLLVAAAQLDPRHALTQWEAGDAMFQAGQTTRGREYFVRAVDEDVCPLRATSTICNSVIEVARQNGVACVDFPKLIEDELEISAGHRIPGDESFLDHVHPTIEQNRRLAWALYEQLAELGIAPHQPSDARLIERVSHVVLDGVDQKQHALALVQVIQVLSWAGKNREALKLTERAEETCPGLSEVVSYRGRLLEKEGQHEAAFDCFLEAVRRNPNDSLARFRLGSAYLRRRDFESARTCFEMALRDTPIQAPAVFQYRLRLGLGNSYAGLRRWQDAAEQFRAAIRLSPQSTDAITALEAVTSQSRSGP
jgi:tetratricopeptide (TPR) repeat protein